MSRRALVVHVIAVVASWLFLAWSGAAGFALGCAAIWWLRPTPRRVQVWAVMAMTAVPAVWLFSNRQLLGIVNPALVTAHPWPGRLAAAALALAALGLLQETWPLTTYEPRPTRAAKENLDDAGA